MNAILSKICSFLPLVCSTWDVFLEYVFLSMVNAQLTTSIIQVNLSILNILVLQLILQRCCMAGMSCVGVKKPSCSVIKCFNLTLSTNSYPAMSLDGPECSKELIHQFLSH